MLERKNASGWVLAMVALTLFVILLIRDLTRKESAMPPLEQASASAGMVMSERERAAALSFSAAFETITAQYTPLVVAIYPHPFPGARPTPLGDKVLSEDFPFAIVERPSPTNASSLMLGDKKNFATETELGFGSGVLVSSDGYILTSHHLLEVLSSRHFSGDSVTVVFHKGRRVSGVIAGTDPLTDVALIKIAAKGLSCAKWGDSDRLRVGQWVLAIGNSMNHPPTVTAGLLCTKGRSKAALPLLDDLIHIDAAIHPNNSGGALVTLEGELVGINTTLLASSMFRNNGVAIPSNLARRIMQSIIKDGRVARGSIGITVQDLDQSLAQALHVSSLTGALIVDVTSRSPAEKAGMRRGDLVLQFAGEPVRNAKDLRNQIAWQPPGQNVPIVIWRDSVKIVCEVIPEEWPAATTSEPAPTFRQQTTNKIGVYIRSLAPEITRRHKVRGVMVAQIDSASPAARILSTGDIIQEINHQSIQSVRDFNAALREMKSGETALLFVRRGERTFFVGVAVL